MQVYDIDINENKMETTPHGTDDFPIAVYDTILSRNVLGFVDWHWHSELQFCCVTAGRVLFKINGSSEEIGEGGGIFVNSGILHSARPLTEDASYICIDASPEIIGGFKNSAVRIKYVEPFVNDSAFSYVLFDGRNGMTDRLHTVYRLVTEKPFAYEAETTAQLIMCWKEIISRSCQEHSQGGDYARLKEILSYIHSRYREKIVLKDLSEQIHVCPSECCRYFKKHMGCTIFEYINNYRINRSTEALLADEGISVSRIAYEYGFGSTSYYIEKFRKKTGMTPLAYRRANRCI